MQIVNIKNKNRISLDKYLKRWEDTMNNPVPINLTTEMKWKIPWKTQLNKTDIRINGKSEMAPYVVDRF